MLASLLRQVVAIGFFYALLLNGGTWVPAVIQSFSQAGATAAGLTDLSPTGVFDQGLALANKILNATSDLGLLDGFFASLIAGITAIVVVIAHRPKALDGVDHVLVIAEGRVQSFGRKEDVLTKVLQRPAPLKVVADSQGATRWTAR